MTETLDLLAQLSLSNRKFEYAQELLERAVGIWPRSARLQMNLGVAYHCLERYEEAITKFQLALRLNRRLGYYFVVAGMVLFGSLFFKPLVSALCLGGLLVGLVILLGCTVLTAN